MCFDDIVEAQKEIEQERNGESQSEYSQSFPLRIHDGSTAKARKSALPMELLYYLLVASKATSMSIDVGASIK